MSKYADLIERWSERDARYGIRKVGGLTVPLSPNEIDSIRVYRMREINDLPALERAKARIELLNWTPPPVTIR